jgi:hypothetical protein
MAFAIVLLLGPGDHEIPRTKDLFDAILTLEPAAREADLYLVNDGNPRIGALEEAGRRFARCIHLRNPLAGARHHPLDKMTAGMICALSAAAVRGAYRYVLKLDTDALVINPFHDSLAAFLDANPGVGIAGSYLRFPDGAQRVGYTSLGPRLARASEIRFLRSVLRENPLEAPAALLAIMKRRAILREARVEGYVDGHHVQGGSYAVAGRVLEQWTRQSLDKSTSLFKWTKTSEDVAISLLVRWLGYELADFNAEGEVFGVWYRRLKAPPETLRRHYAIIHSLKTAEGQDEQELRAVFRRQRQAFRAGGVGAG